MNADRLWNKGNLTEDIMNNFENSTAINEDDGDNVVDDVQVLKMKIPTDDDGEQMQPNATAKLPTLNLTYVSYIKHGRTDIKGSSWEALKPVIKMILKNLGREGSSAD